MVDIGSEVHRGQLLAVLEAPEINSQLAGAESRIKQQEAVYFASKATYDRLVKVPAKHPAPYRKMIWSRPKLKRIRTLANVEAAKSSYKESEANLAYLEIRAPFDGIITARNVNLGSLCWSGRQNHRSAVCFTGPKTHAPGGFRS